MGSLSRAKRYHSLDLWRGVACLAVVATHSIFYTKWTVETSGFMRVALAAVKRGWLGVPLFFVISGYCIAATASGVLERGGSTRGYFVRRFRRIYPPYWTWLGLTVLVVGLVEHYLAPGFFNDDTEAVAPGSAMNGWQWLGNLTLTESWRHHLAGGSRHQFLAPAWTLCLEEQFYAVIGMALLLRRWFAWIPALATLASLVVWAVGADGWDARLGGVFLGGHWLMFVAGLGTFYAVVSTSRRVRGLMIVLVTSGLLLMTVVWASDLSESQEMKLGRLVAFGFALFLICFKRYDHAIDRARLLRPVRWCGRISYSLYLTHWPVVKVTSKLLARASFASHAGTLFVTVPTSMALSIGIGWLFHTMVEKRFLNPPLEIIPEVSAPSSLLS